MLPSASSAGLVTGCRLSAMGTATFRVCGLLRWPLVATTTGPDVAPSGTRATRKPSELITTVPSTSPNCTLGRRNSGGRRPDPVIRTSPPASARAGDTASMCGPPFTFFLPRIRSENPMTLNFLGGRRSSGDLHSDFNLRVPGLATMILEGQNAAEDAPQPARKFRPRHHPA